MRRFAGLVLFHGLLTLGISFASAAEKTTPPTAGTNVPVSEGFASKSPYVLYREDNRYVLRRHGERSGVDGGSVQIPARRGEGIPVRLAPRPS